MNATATPVHFAAGQLWQCKGRSADEQPTLLINLVEHHPLGGEIYHVTLTDLRVRHPGMPSGIMQKLDHAPVIKQALEHSGMTYLGAREPDPAYRKGYAEWKQAFDAGHAGSFGVSVATILEIVERQLNGTPLEQP